jgi:hypothetical protein
MVAAKAMPNAAMPITLPVAKTKTKAMRAASVG